MSNSDIADWERKHGVRLSSDLKNYVRTLNGMSLTAHGEMDDDFFRFLPLAQMTPERAVSAKGRSGMFLFVDYLHLCYWYCVELDRTERDETRVFLGGTAKPLEDRLVASSLAEFFELYMKNQRALEILPIGNSL